jgi:hypothetical protein
MSVLPQAIAPNPHTNLLNVCIQIANKLGFQQQEIKKVRERSEILISIYHSNKLSTFNTMNKLSYLRVCKM